MTIPVSGLVGAGRKGARKPPPKGAVVPTPPPVRPTYRLPSVRQYEAYLPPEATLKFVYPSAREGRGMVPTVLQWEQPYDARIIDLHKQDSPYLAYYYLQGGLLSFGRHRRGSPYEWGGKGKACILDPKGVGLDCSGFVGDWLDIATDMDEENIPRSSQAMLDIAVKQNIREIMPGDILIREGTAPPEGSGRHVGIYVGWVELDGEMVPAVMDAAKAGQGRLIDIRKWYTRAPGVTWNHLGIYRPDYRAFLNRSQMVMGTTLTPLGAVDPARKDLHGKVFPVTVDDGRTVMMAGVPPVPVEGIDARSIMNDIEHIRKAPSLDGALGYIQRERARRDWALGEAEKRPMGAFPELIRPGTELGRAVEKPSRQMERELAGTIRRARENYGKYYDWLAENALAFRNYVTPYDLYPPTAETFKNAPRATHNLYKPSSAQYALIARDIGRLTHEEVEQARLEGMRNLVKSGEVNPFLYSLANTYLSSLSWVANGIGWLTGLGNIGDRWLGIDDQQTQDAVNALQAMAFEHSPWGAGSGALIGGLAGIGLPMLGGAKLAVSGAQLASATGRYLGLAQKLEKLQRTVSSGGTLFTGSKGVSRVLKTASEVADTVATPVSVARNTFLANLGKYIGWARPWNSANLGASAVLSLGTLGHVYRERLREGKSLDTGEGLVILGTLFPVNAVLNSVGIFGNYDRAMKHILASSGTMAGITIADQMAQNLAMGRGVLADLKEAGATGAILGAVLGAIFRLPATLSAKRSIYAETKAKLTSGEPGTSDTVWKYRIETTDGEVHYAEGTTSAEASARFASSPEGKNKTIASVSYTERVGFIEGTPLEERLGKAFVVDDDGTTREVVLWNSSWDNNKPPEEFVSAQERVTQQSVEDALVDIYGREVYDARMEAGDDVFMGLQGDATVRALSRRLSAIQGAVARGEEDVSVLDEMREILADYAYGLERAWKEGGRARRPHEVKVTYRGYDARKQREVQHTETVRLSDAELASFQALDRLRRSVSLQKWLKAPLEVIQRGDDPIRNIVRRFHETLNFPSKRLNPDYDWDLQKTSWEFTSDTTRRMVASERSIAKKLEQDELERTVRILKRDVEGATKTAGLDIEGFLLSALGRIRKSFVYRLLPEEARAKVDNAYRRLSEAVETKGLSAEVQAMLDDLPHPNKAHLGLADDVNSEAYARALARKLVTAIRDAGNDVRKTLASYGDDIEGLLADYGLDEWLDGFYHLRGTKTDELENAVREAMDAVEASVGREKVEWIGNQRKAFGTINTARRNSARGLLIRLLYGNAKLIDRAMKEDGIPAGRPPAEEPPPATEPSPATERPPAEVEQKTVTEEQPLVEAPAEEAREVREAEAVPPAEQPVKPAVEQPAVEPRAEPVEEDIFGEALPEKYRRRAQEKPPEEPPVTKRKPKPKTEPPAPKGEAKGVPATKEEAVEGVEGAEKPAPKSKQRKPKTTEPPAPKGTAEEAPPTEGLPLAREELDRRDEKAVKVTVKETPEQASGGAEMSSFHRGHARYQATLREQKILPDKDIDDITIETYPKQDAYGATIEVPIARTGITISPPLLGAHFMPSRRALATVHRALVEGKVKRVEEANAPRDADITVTSGRFYSSADDTIVEYIGVTVVLPHVAHYELYHYPLVLFERGSEAGAKLIAEKVVTPALQKASPPSYKFGERKEGGFVSWREVELDAGVVKGVIPGKRKARVYALVPYVRGELEPVIHSRPFAPHILKLLYEVIPAKGQMSEVTQRWSEVFEMLWLPAHYHKQAFNSAISDVIAETIKGIGYRKGSYMPFAPQSFSVLYPTYWRQGGFAGEALEGTQTLEELLRPLSGKGKRLEVEGRVKIEEVPPLGTIFHGSVVEGKGWAGEIIQRPWSRRRAESPYDLIWRKAVREASEVDPNVDIHFLDGYNRRFLEGGIANEGGNC